MNFIMIPITEAAYEQQKNDTKALPELVLVVSKWTKMVLNLNNSSQSSSKKKQVTSLSLVIRILFGE